MGDFSSPWLSLLSLQPTASNCEVTVPGDLVIAGGEHYTIETAWVTRGRKMRRKSVRKEDDDIPRRQQSVQAELYLRELP